MALPTATMHRLEPANLATCNDTVELVHPVVETITNFHTFAQCGTPVGVGLDGKGKVWMIDYNGWTWQMDPMTFEKKQLPVANVHYTYSDFTGSGLSGIVPQ